MSYTVPKASDVLSRDPGAFSFRIKMRAHRFMANQEGCRVRLKQNSLSGNIINYIIPIQLLYVCKKALQKGRMINLTRWCFRIQTRDSVTWQEALTLICSWPDMFFFFQKASLATQGRYYAYFSGNWKAKMLKMQIYSYTDLLSKCVFTVYLLCSMLGA